MRRGLSRQSISGSSSATLITLLYLFVSLYVVYWFYKAIKRIQSELSEIKNKIGVTTGAQNPPPLAQPSPGTSPKEMAYCAKCGQMLRPADTFCPRCGQKKG